MNLLLIMNCTMNYVDIDITGANIDDVDNVQKILWTTNPMFIVLCALFIAGYFYRLKKLN